MADERTISAISYDLNTLRSPTQIYDVMTGQLKPYDDPTREDVPIPTGNVYTITGVLDDDGNLRKMSIAELVMCVCLERATKEEEKIIAIMAEMSENTNLLNHLSSIENELLAGKKIEDIKGEYEYYGKKYTSALDFLAEVLGVDYKDYQEKRANLNDIITRLEAGEAIHTMSGSYTLDGNVYENAADYICALGLNFNVAIYGTCSFRNMLSLIDEFPHLTMSEKLTTIGFASDWFRMPFTIDGFGNDLERYARPQVVPVLRQEYDNVVSQEARTDIIAMSTDDLITKMETKMDSLNSFSQRNMLELQSETNKRDQAYDLITNFLKSLNTVQVGIANNI
ncbi:MAG: hypothetical protein MJ106_00740 [Lentisphaeria bacterium]|nr:hypothetical protein [Lentisphaeria bacterium]